MEKYNELVNLLNKFRNEYINSLKGRTREDYFLWLSKKTNILLDSGIYEKPEGLKIKRGHVFWTEFGFNIGEEFSGKHPSIVLQTRANMAIVLPLSTQEPTEIQINSGIYVEVDRVYNFKNIRRWINVLNAVPISILRFDYSKIGNIKGYELDKIKEVGKRNSIWI